MKDNVTINSASGVKTGKGQATDKRRQKREIRKIKTDEIERQGEKSKREKRGTAEKPSSLWRLNVTTLNMGNKAKEIVTRFGNQDNQAKFKIAMSQTK